jgi:hypothetical protein
MHWEKGDVGQGEVLTEGKQLSWVAGQNHEIALWSKSDNPGKKLKTMRSGSLKYPVYDVQIDADTGAIASQISVMLLHAGAVSDCKHR